MDILLHTGAHRTATTTMQRMLHRHRPALRRAGVLYWGPSRLRGGVFRGLYGTAGAVLPWQARKGAARVRMGLAEAEALGAAAIVVSEENILGSMRDVLDGIGLYPEAGARVARFAAPFREHEITICIGIRSYDAWWASVMAFCLMKGGPLPRRAFCDRLVTQPRRWRHLIAEIARAVPEARVKVWSYEALGNRPDTVLRRLSGREMILAGGQDWHNRSPRPEKLRDYLEECGCDPGLIRETGGRFMPFDPDQRVVLRAQYAEDLAWLNTGAGGLADYIDEVRATILDPTGPGRGRSDERRDRKTSRHRSLA